MNAKMKNKILRHNSKGQAIVEYIIIIAIVAVAALTALGIFSDRVRALIMGVASSFGATESDNSSSSKEVLQKMDKDGVDF